MAIFYKTLGGIISAAGVLWLGFLIVERYDSPPIEIDFASVVMASTAIILGLLVAGFGELCKTIAAIEMNTRKQGY